MALPDSFLQELRMKIEIDDVISSYVSLKKRGNTSVGLCPFHNEKTPSFTVYHDTQSYYCFGCGAGGDAVNFIKRIENLDYIDAVKSLAQRAGMQMPDDATYDDSLAKRRRKVLEVNRATAKYYHSYMMSEEGRAGLDYFLNRGLSLKTIKRFGLGYAPNSWDKLLKHLKENGFTIGDMLDAGVIKKGNKGYYDNFRNRVMTPIIDVRGNVIAFGGRVLDDSKPKYINTSDTLVYKKTNELFALNYAKDSGEDSLILCEGYMDVIAMHQAGFTNAVAGCGTALTNEQVRLISRYAKEVILAYDSDEAGQKALNKAISLFKQTDVKVKIPNLVGGKDPDEIIKTYGRDKFKGMLDSSRNDIEYAIINLRSRYNLNSTVGKSDFMKEAIKVLAGCEPIEQDLYVSRLSEELNIDKVSIKAQLDNYKQGQSKRTRRREYQKIIDNQAQEIRKQTISQDETYRKMKAEERIIALLLEHPDCYSLCDKIKAEHMTEGFIRKVYSLIIDKIEKNFDLSLTSFSGELTDSELGRLSGIIARAVISADAKSEFNDCANAIEEEYNKKNRGSAAELTDDAFRNMFKKNIDNT